MYSKLVGLLCLIGSGAMSQEASSGYDPTDSSVVPSKRLPQHTEFMANNYAFPAKPRNQWELGLKVGAFSIAGDVRSVFPGFGAGIHVRKALGYVFSLRGDLGFGTTKGLNYTRSFAYAPNSAWTPYLVNGAPSQGVFYNYKSNIYDLSLQGVITLNNIRFHRAKTGFNIYGFAGIGGMIYNTKIDALNGQGQPYDFSTVGTGFYADRKELKKQVRNILDGDYARQKMTGCGQNCLVKISALYSIWALECSSS
jgi:hypothetical protein